MEHLSQFEHPSPPRFAVPAGAGDCHVHIFGPFSTYPLVAKPAYTARPADLSFESEAPCRGCGK